MNQQRLFNFVGQLALCATHDIGYQSESFNLVELHRCPNCGGSMRRSSGWSRTRKGGSSGFSVECTACGYSDGDGDGWVDEEAAMEDYYDGLARMAADPRQEYFDSFCQRCEKTPAEPASITCWDCDVELYGEEKALEMRRQRELRLNPPLYVPVTIQGESHA